MASVGNDKGYESKQNDVIPVQADAAAVEDGVDEITADSDAQLERDDNEAIDESNIVEGRTRHAQPETGTYKEPGDDEGLPTETEA